METLGTKSIVVSREDLVNLSGLAVILILQCINGNLNVQMVSNDQSAGNNKRRWTYGFE